MHAALVIGSSAGLIAAWIGLLACVLPERKE
jgi:hypothetical protein